MRILIIARGLPSPEEPQWGCFEFDQARALKKNGHDVAVLAVDRRWKFNFRKLGIRRKKLEGIPTVEAFFTPHLFIPWINLKLRSLYFKITFRFFRKYWGMPDVIYSHYLTNTAAILPLASRLNVPVVGLEHWSKLMKNSLSEEVSYLANKTFNSPNLTLLTVSENLREAIKSRFGADSAVVPNMVGEEFLKQSVVSKYDKFTFVSVGALIYRKGFDILIEAASILKGLTNKEFQIIIIGVGPLRERLQSIIDEKNLTKSIKLVGSKTKSEIHEYFAKSNAFVLASRSETFGVVYIEAMAMGLPVIATDCGIPTDLVGKSDGIVCNPENVNDLTDAMAYIMDHYSNYVSEAIRERCISRYSPNIVVKQIEKKLIEAVNE